MVAVVCNRCGLTASSGLSETHDQFFRALTATGWKLEDEEGDFCSACANIERDERADRATKRKDN